jgi:hypothetical protein
MSGNSEEWEDNCGLGADAQDPTDDSCTLRGGPFWCPDGTNCAEVDVSCDGASFAPYRTGMSVEMGFRCCSP